MTSWQRVTLSSTTISSITPKPVMKIDKCVAYIQVKRKKVKGKICSFFAFAPPFPNQVKRRKEKCDRPYFSLFFQFIKIPKSPNSGGLSKI
jgi:hypothetical protein